MSTHRSHGSPRFVHRPRALRGMYYLSAFLGLLQRLPGPARSVGDALAVVRLWQLRQLESPQGDTEAG